jgi:hypothetical protein
MALALTLNLAAHAQVTPVAVAGNWRDVSVEDYRKHLESLDRLVAACQKQRSAAICDPTQVGLDERLSWIAGGVQEKREIRYGWLRLLLEKAAKHEESEADKKLKPESGRPQPVEALLTQAREQLAEDWKQSCGSMPSRPNRAPERKSLSAILAGREFQGVNELSFKERLLEELANWVNHLLARMAGYGSRSPWIAFALYGFLLAAICLGLAWALIRRERRSRIRPEPEPSHAPGTPSAREWQLWLADAHAMAAQELWREAIHDVYWASISRLESNRLWPAGRARTPREYLALLAGNDPRKAHLEPLTRRFERIWYGRREANHSDYLAALRLAAELGVK